MAWQGMPEHGAVGRDRALADVHVALIARLRSHQAEIEKAIFKRVQDDRFDRTGSQDPAYVDGLRAAGTAGLEYVLNGVEPRGKSLAPVPEAALAQARRAARVGVGLDTVLRRYLAGHAVVEDFIVWEFERADAPLEAGALRVVLQTVAVLADRLIRAVSGAYGREAKQVAKQRVAAANGGPRAHERRSARGDIERSQAGSSAQGVGTGDRRQRILTAMVEVVAERGFVHTTVRLVSARAGVSASTFYAEFAGLRECFIAVLDLGLGQAYELIAGAFACETSWPNRVRSTLIALLIFFDSAPELTRVWFVESLAAGLWALEHRERSLVRVRSVILEYLPASPLGESEQWIVAGVISSVVGLIHTHLITQKKPGPLIDLLGPLTSLVTLPYVGLADVEAEVARARRLSHAIKVAGKRPQISNAEGDDQSTTRGLPASSLWGGGEWGSPSSARMARRAKSPVLPPVGPPRAGECLRYIAGHSGASNNEIAAAIGIVHRSQISKLLSRLHQEGLIAKPPSARPGASNAWRLTDSGTAHALLLDGETGRRS